MKTWSVFAACALLSLLLGGHGGEAAQRSKHQYDGWKKVEYQSKTWHYRNYRYGTGKQDYHEARYYSKKYYPKYGGQRYYYYNPHLKRYWGYYDPADEAYYLLGPEHRKEHLSDIDPDTFKKQDAFPKIPNTEITFEPPPKGFPDDE